VIYLTKAETSRPAIFNGSYVQLVGTLFFSLYFYMDHLNPLLLIFIIQQFSLM